MAIRFSTESGAYYIVDTDKMRIQRVKGDMNPWMRLPNGEWHNIIGHSPIAVGLPVIFDLQERLYRRTTKVTDVEEFDVNEFILESEADLNALKNDKTNWPYTERDEVLASV